MKRRFSIEFVYRSNWKFRKQLRLFFLPSPYTDVSVEKYIDLPSKRNRPQDQWLSPHRRRVNETLSLKSAYPVRGESRRCHRRSRQIAGRCGPISSLHIPTLCRLTWSENT